MSDDLSLSEDAFIFGGAVMKKEETVTLEKRVYDVLLKRNADLMDENARLREALETICAIYEINGAEWRFDKRLYDEAKEALDNGAESRD